MCLIFWLIAKLDLATTFQEKFWQFVAKSSLATKTELEF